MNRRKELQNEFGVKQRTMGVFQIVNGRNGKRYVASSPTLDSAWQREKFMLDTGSHINSALQSEYKEQAGAAFDFEILEKLEFGDEAGKEGSDGQDGQDGRDSNGAEQPAAGVLNRSTVLSYRNALKKLERKWLDELKPYEPAGYNRPPADV
ncbi:GIY-YIG nuclease family protein [Paenibacillus rhizovicinus]|uniref:GIY-YIG nuclease family protein n=1 Tax=Paenibacillus rhizovicinus TaxID=2704463 RepID=A0A6C0NXR2_9BACL|nr:GIY-YIG nuclease family protein [Paenibacillus rhizovicinus]QHW31034.1 GIY-YIG nuclease family protein [Paenibacillus rhizovicinus]